MNHPCSVCVTAPCDAGWVEYNTHCYFIRTTSEDWGEASTYCQNQGAYLADILDAAEDAFVKSLS